MERVLALNPIKMVTLNIGSTSRIFIYPHINMQQDDNDGDNDDDANLFFSHDNEFRIFLNIGNLFKFVENL